MTRKIVVAALVVLFAHSTRAHEVDCEKQVGILRTDAGGNVVLGDDGSPAFSTAPQTILSVESYPVTVGWQMKVNNLASETSIVRQLEDPFLSASGATVFGAPAAPFELAIGQTSTFTAAVRIESYEQCLALAGAPRLTCGDVSENRLVVTTDTDVAECRARLVCRPQRPPGCVAPEWTGVIRYFGPEGSASTIDRGWDVAVDCDGATHFVGEASYLATLGNFALLARLDAFGAVVEERTWAGANSPRNEASSVALDGSGRRIVTGGYINQGFLRVVERDGTFAWEVTAPRVAHGGAPFRGAKLDADGNVYAALVGAGLPTGYPPPSDQDVFVRKYTPAGALVWETALASVGQDDVSALAVTPAGEVFVTGWTVGDLIPGAPPTGFKAFLARLGPDGAIRWVKQVGMVGGFHGIAVDALGNLALAGGDTVASFTVASFDQDGNLRWQRSIAAATPGGASGVALDATGAIWVVGKTGVPNITPLLRTDAIVARYDAAGNLLWSKQLGAGAPLDEDLVDIAIDAAGYGVATGSTNAPDPVNGGILSANVVLLRIAPDGTY